jgi:hypothetical protein
MTDLADIDYVSACWLVGFLIAVIAFALVLNVEPKLPRKRK